MKNIIVLAILSVIVSTSCRKKLDTVANIYIKDENNASVSNAMVVLYGTNTRHKGSPYLEKNVTITNAAPVFWHRIKL